MARYFTAKLEEPAQTFARRHFMPFIALLLASLCSSVPADSRTQKKPSVTLYVFTAEIPGAPKEEDAARAEAVTDMREALRKKAGLEVVDSRAGADVLVEVIGREEREGAEGGFGGAALTKMGQMIIRLHVTSGEEEIELKGIGQGTWGRAAKDGADRVLKWVARLESKKKGSESRH
jgi:hypothetical protein